MLFFAGGQTETQAQEQKLLQRLQVNFPQITALTSQLGYFVDVIGQLTENELQQLSQMLPSPNTHTSLKQNSHQLWVVPRFGTLSAWSSKATDIAHICGLSSIHRIEHGVCYTLKGINLNTLLAQDYQRLIFHLYDPLTQSCVVNTADLAQLFLQPSPSAMISIDVLQDDQALIKANRELGLALSDVEMQYLQKQYKALKRNPSLAELMMFAQVNSEHCRHKIFNARWWINGKKQPLSLFDMIRNTYKQHPQNVLIAYSDNAAVLKGHKCKRFFCDPDDKRYSAQTENQSIVLKVETHNHPTAISPFSGAATGSGGEIRDEAATGCGARSKMGMVGFMVSHLEIPEFSKPWEIFAPHPAHMASPLQIMLEAPIGAASFSNEFGRPSLCGFFRTFEMQDYGYHKPIMIAGGVGAIRDVAVSKRSIPEGAKLIVLGGPAMAIGLGGGSASSMTSGESSQHLDFASVQRANPQMQRRAQEVIDVCWAMGERNPILSIHDVGAGGLSNALPELVHGSGKGGAFELRAIPNAAPGMSPKDIWCNEAQERYVLAILPENLEHFRQIAQRERCPFAVVGIATDEAVIRVHDSHHQNYPIDLPSAILFEKLPQLEKRVQSYQPIHLMNGECEKIDLAQAIARVLQFPAVADKSFLITIGDRSVSGLVTRDQMVGPWQVPVADVAVTCADYEGYVGEAMAVGERTPLALTYPAAAARMAVGEALTNLAATAVDSLSDVSLSANWMAAAGDDNQAAALFDAVQAIGMQFCPALGVSIPVGKDSLSMQTRWQVEQKQHQNISPVSLIITACGRVRDVRATLTPQLQTEVGDTLLLFIDLGAKQHRLGGSVLAQTSRVEQTSVPDCDDPELLVRFFDAIQSLNRQELLLAYHDRSDGGLITTLCEMAFAAHCGLDIDITTLGNDPLSILFCEELGAVVQIRAQDFTKVMQILAQFKLQEMTHTIATVNGADQLIITHQQECIYQEDRITLRRLWSETSYRLSAMRDNPACAKQQYDHLLVRDNPGLNVKLTFDLAPSQAANINLGAQPRVAILREQGVNGHVEMAAAFSAAGFECIDVHMSELLSGDVNLESFHGLAACGGFSYGDVFGAGRGWANSILMHARVRDVFQAFFARSDTFTLGVCNGCQMLSQLRGMIPGAKHWPAFLPNASQQFEARLSLVEILPSPSILFQGMAGSVLPIAVAHGEGRVAEKVPRQYHVMRYVDHHHQPTQAYPYNPNGSIHGITGLTSEDGRATILMPHPERVFRRVQLSWHPKHWPEKSPWMQLFLNARKWLSV